MTWNWWDTVVTLAGVALIVDGLRRITGGTWRRRSRTPQPRTPLPSGNRAPVATTNRDGTV